MAGSPYVQFAGPSYHLGDRKSAVQSAVNCYVQQMFSGASIMVSTPGEVEIANLGFEGRGSRVVSGRWFVVAGATLYEMRADGTSTVRGTLTTSTGAVGMSDNRTQLAIVDGYNLYILSLSSNTFTNVSSPAWRGSNDVQELDGYFIFVDIDTDQFYLSAIDDGTSLDALDFSSADSSPDNILAHIVSHRQIWFFGELSAEIWVDSGDAAFPFVRYNSYTMDIGIVGKRAAIKAADTIFWVGQTREGRGIVYMASGNQPQRVSTISVEEALRGSSDLSRVTMWAYQIEGHEFIGINAPGLSTTWVFDAATQMWHERGEWSAGWLPLRSRLVTAFGSDHYAIDSYGSLVRLDTSFNTLNGRTLARERTWPHMVSPAMEPIVYNGVELAVKTGAGGNISLEISNDGGFTWGAPLLRSLGAIGRWMQRVRWLGLGASFNRVFRIRVTDDVPFAIHEATVSTQ